MPSIMYFRIFVGALLFIMSQSAFCVNLWLTEKQFQHRGAIEATGQIQNVVVMSKTGSSESGTVEIRITLVINGTLEVPTITMPFTKTLVAYDSASNWDLIGAVDTGLEMIEGKDLLMFLTQTDGAYSLYPAGNAVQDLKNGLLLGRITSVNKEGKPAKRRNEKVNLEIHVDETIFGWVDGSMIILPLSRNIRTGDDGRGRSRRSYGDMEDPMPSRDSHQNTVPALQLDEQCCDTGDSRLYLVDFFNGEIREVKVATKSFVQALRTEDLR